MDSFDTTKKRLALVDICGTLISVTTIIDFTEHFFLSPKKNKNFTWSKWLFHYGCRVLRKFRLMDEVAYRAHFLHLVKGCKVSDIDLLAQQYSEHLQKKIKPSILKKIRTLEKEGCVIILVTAGLDVYLKQFAQSLQAELISTEAEQDHNGFYTGKRKGIDCRGRGKVAKVQEAYTAESVDWENSYALGNEISDIPILSLVGNPIVVDPADRLRLHAKNNEWEIILTQS